MIWERFRLLVARIVTDHMLVMFVAFTFAIVRFMIPTGAGGGFTFANEFKDAAHIFFGMLFMAWCAYGRFYGGVALALIVVELTAVAVGLLGVHL